MKAMILAAGTDTCMKPLTAKIPKPMLKVGNKPVLEYNVDLCKNYNIKDIMVNLHAFPEQIDAHFSSGAEYGVNIAYSLEKEFFGDAGAIRRVKSFWNSTFVVLNGGSITDIDLTDMLKFHRENNSLATIAVKHVEDLSSHSFVNFNKESRIKSLNGNREGIKSRWANIGVYILEPEIIKYIPQKTFYDINADLFPKLLKLGAVLHAYKTDAFRNDLNGLHDFWKLNLDILSNKIPVFNTDSLLKHQGKVVHPSAKVDRKTLLNAHPPIVIGKNSIIKSGAQLHGPLIIGEDVYVDSKALIKQSVILDNSYIGKGVEIDNSIINQDTHISIPHSFATTIDDNKILTKYVAKSFRERFKEVLVNITDRILAFTGLLFLTPLFALVALLIKIDSPGPVFYISKRTRFPGRFKKQYKWHSFKNTKEIKYYVFRTMQKDAAKNVKQLDNKYKNRPFVKIDDDPRVTRVGRLLRKTSIDELPLLWNVVKGEMSLVGIWALPTYEAEYIATSGLKYTDSDREIDLSEMARIRFHGKLGLAGYWQSRGRSNLTAEERAIHDSFQTILTNQTQKNKKFMGDYSNSSSYLGYWKILFETFNSVIKRTGAI